MPRSVLRVGTRGSALALAQAEGIRQAISKIITHRNFELVPIITEGDRAPSETSLASSTGLLASDLHQALVSGKIDLAVHSARDLPPVTPDGVFLAAIPKREDPRDALITRTGAGLNSLAPGSTVGAASPSRAAQLLALQRGLVPTPIQGHLDERLRKLSDGHVHALVVALAGLKRLGRADRAAEILPINLLLPAPGQGALAVECRMNDKNMRNAAVQLEDADSRAAFEAERSFLVSVGGSPALPLAALAEATGDRVRIRGLVATSDGKRVLADQVEGDDPEKAGIELADRLRAAGADDIIASIDR